MVWKNVSKKEKKVEVKITVPTYRITVLKGNVYITLTPDIVDFLGKPEKVAVLADGDAGCLGVMAAADGEESVKAQYSKTKDGKTPTMTVLARNAIEVLGINAKDGALVAEAEFDSSDEEDDTEDIVYIDITHLEVRGSKAKKPAAKKSSKK